MQTSASNSSTSTLQPLNPEPGIMYMDVKLEAILPRIVLESAIDTASQRDRPKMMQVQISRFSVTNIRETGTSRADLAQALHSLQEGSLVFSSGFPSKAGDLCIVTDRILSHVAAADVNSSTPSSPSISPQSSSGTLIPRHALWKEPRDVWCVKLDPIWAEFFGARSSGNKSIPFIDAVPVTLWVHGKSGDLFGNGPAVKSADLHVIAHVSNLISVQIDHYQFLFLLRLSEEFTELTTFLTLDKNRILKDSAVNTSMIVGCVVPQVEVTLIMPSATPGKESSGGDGESVSASLVDEQLTNPSHPLRNMNPYSTSIESPTSQSMDLPPPQSCDMMTQSSQRINSANLIAKSEPNQNTRMDSTLTRNKARGSVIDASFPKDINTGLMSMKKGFSNFMTSIDSALKSGVDDISDTISIQSDISSDSESYFMVLTDTDKTTDCNDLMFK